MQFIATLKYTLTGICSPDSHLLQMTEHGNTVSGNGMANTRDDGIKGSRTAFVHDVNTVVINEQ
jgi:hypothetical protein